MKKKIFIILGIIASVCVLSVIVANNESKKNPALENSPVSREELPSVVSSESTREPEKTPIEPVEEVNSFHYEDIASYEKTPYTVVNGDIPYLMEEVEGENYSNLDTLGRCGVAYCRLSKETMPKDGEKRGSIKDIKPTGWHTVKYENLIEEHYLYNRCHLVGWQLSAENDNPLNLITGTRYMNLSMLEIENEIADYIKTGGVKYRVTPVFVGEELICRGLLIEVESDDKALQRCRFFYNVQPGIIIDYLTGDSKEEIKEPSEIKYVLNTNTKKIHIPSCDSVKDMKEKNKKETTENIASLKEQGYTPCQRCNP